MVNLCLELDILVSIENPLNSLFWLYPAIKAIAHDYGHSTVFANCMHGGKRDKLTKWWANKHVYHSLQAECNNQHKHASWAPTKVGVALRFPSADEAAYPMLLCKRVATILLAYAISMGAKQTLDLQEQLQHKHATSHRWVLGLLPGGKSSNRLSVNSNLTEISSILRIMTQMSRTFLLHVQRYINS